MNPFQRTQVSTLVQRLGEEPRQLIALFGPRQTGKTTILRQALGQIPFGSRYLAVDDPDPSVPCIPFDAGEETFPLLQREPRDYESNRLRIAYEFLFRLQ